MRKLFKYTEKYNTYIHTCIPTYETSTRIAFIKLLKGTLSCFKLQYLSLLDIFGNRVIHKQMNFYV